MSWTDEARARVGQGPARARCLAAVDAFVAGYAAGAPIDDPPDLRGFTVEGAAFARADASFATGADLPFAEIGLGWSRAFAGLPVHERPWVADGHGFADAFQRTARVVDRQAPGPPRWDRGVGRALWFLCAGHPVRISRQIAAFAPERRAALWTGVGIALAYTGGGSPADHAAVVALSGEHVTDVHAGGALLTAPGGQGIASSTAW